MSVSQEFDPGGRLRDLAPVTRESYSDPAQLLAWDMSVALIEIVGQRWIRPNAHIIGQDGPWCPSCGDWISYSEHRKSCAWLIAARALGIA